MKVYRILVVDQDPAVHQVLASALALPSWQLECTHGSADALARIESTPYDLVVADSQLAGVDGLELLHRIRQVRPETRVIIMTAASTPEAVIQAIREKAFAYFSKPFSAAAVGELISQALGSPPSADDIQILSARPNWITLRMRCQTGSADRLVQFLRELEMDLPARQREDVAAAFHELLMNAVEHGGHYDPQKWVRVSAIRAERAMIYHIQDPGNGFSLDNIPHAAISNPPDAPVHHAEVRMEQGVRPGGFGILLTRHLVDELIYNEKGNEVLFVKYL